MTRPALPNVHPTAIISDAANLAPDIKIGPYAVLEGPITAGPGCVIDPHARLIGPLTLGANNQIGTGAVLGGTPQHLAYKGEPTSVEIGDGNIFREHVTVSRGMPIGAGPGTGTTRIGNRNLFMAGCHVAHDCVIGNDVVLANSALLAGHVTIGDRAFISGNSAVHQFCRIGRLAFLSGVSGSTMDMPPFWVVQEMNRVRGLNLVGMKRAGIAPAERAAIRSAYRIIYMTRPALPLSAALARIETELGTFAAVREIVDFIRASKRGICGAHRFGGKSDQDGDDAIAA